MSGALFITLIIVLIVGILIYRRIYITDTERFENREKLILALLVTIAIGLLVAITSTSKNETNEQSNRQEYGLFNHKKAAVVKTERMNYGNPMKRQDYIPRNAIRVTPKTDSSKIYVRA